MRPLKIKKNKPKKLKERNKFLLFDKNWNIIETIVLNRSFNRDDLRSMFIRPDVMCLLIAVINGRNKPEIYLKNIDIEQQETT